MAYIKLEDLQKIPIRIDHYDKENGNEDFVLGIETAIEYAEHLPTADVEEVKHGHWIEDIKTLSTVGDVELKALVGYRCSLCGRAELHKEPYCNCGAKMDGERK